MRWNTLYSTSELSMLDSIAFFILENSPIETIQAFTPLERAVAGVITTLFLSSVVLGFLQDDGKRAVTTCRQSPLISICIGLPVVAIAGLLAGVGTLIIDTSIGAFFGVLFVSLGRQ